ncbi:MAG: MarR family transcriptional regulator [Pusillimonas sp.]|nr:MarR family transcriptional regulator [Pusillimonas sp.]MBC41778.1 MarR family transcriptional regulator [Pusillimonas sp.]HCN71110.1 MarR family transcriptional regulator [Pusillimonas sp.]
MAAGAAVRSTKSRNGAGKSGKGPKGGPQQAFAKGKEARAAIDTAGPRAQGIELETYHPAYFTFIATKLASGAAAVYRRHYGVGIEIWRVLVMLALEDKVSVNMVCKLIGMDKGSVSRCFKSMHEKGLITFSHDANDGRVRYATLTELGWQKHNQIKAIALERQRAFLACLSQEEADVLTNMLLRLHANLPQVEKATQRYLREHHIGESEAD